MSDIFTPYAAAKFVNEQLEKANLTKRIPPQMMYNYTKARVNQGKKPLIEFNEASGVNQKDLERWTKEYIAKQSSKETVDAK